MERGLHRLLSQDAEKNGFYFSNLLNLREKIIARRLSRFGRFNFTLFYFTEKLIVRLIESPSESFTVITKEAKPFPLGVN